MGCEGAVSVAQQDADRVALLIRDGDIQLPVAIEIPQHNRHRSISGRGLDLGLKCAISLAEQYADHVVVVVVGYGEIGNSVPVKIANRDRPGIESRVVRHLCGERSITLAQQHSYSSICGVGYNDVEIAVTAKVADGDSLRLVARGIVHFGLEGTIAIAQKNTHSIAVGIGYSDV